MKKLLILLICFSVIEITFSQNKRKTENIASKNIVQPNRIEFEINPKDGKYKIISAEDKGMLIINPTREIHKKGYEWQFYLLDSMLNILWKRCYIIPFNTNFLGSDYSDESFYLLFSKFQYRLEKMEVIKLNYTLGDTSIHLINTVFPMQLSYFESLGETLILGGVANFRSVVILFNTEEEKIKVLPGFYNNKSNIIDIQIDDKTNSFTVILNETTIRKKITISLKTFYKNGELLFTKKLSTDYEKSLVDGIPTSFASNIQYVIGTYAKKRSDYSRGLYIAKLNRGQQELINYFNYADLTNFFSYMSTKREARVKERILKRKTKDKKIKFNYRLLIHDVIQRGDEYVLIGEAYYPKYSNTGNPYTGFNTGRNNWIGSNDWMNPNFVGYRYTHAVVVGFDRKGNLLWDNSFEINDVLSYDLKKFVNVNVDKEKIVLLYIFENVIRAKVIQGNEILEGKSFNPIELNFQSDIVKDNYKDMEGLEKWYGDYFYAYGIQKIKNLKDKDVKLNRKVFYINKIKYN